MTGPVTIQSMVMDTLGKFKSMGSDNFRMDSVIDPLSTTKALKDLQELPFSTVFDTIFLGKNPELVGEWQESLTRYLKSVGRTTGKMAIGELSSFIGGVPGAVAAELLGNVLEVALDLFATEEKVIAWQPGMWIVIDLETKRHDPKDTVRKEELAQMMMFSDFDTYTEHEDVERKNYSVGLYADAGSQPGFHTVYNFAAHRFEEKSVELINYFFFMEIAFSRPGPWGPNPS